MHILLVEDDSAIVATLTDLLVSEGFSVTSRACQNEAVALLGTSVFDLALLDIKLTQGTGFAVCAAARERAPHMPVIFLTASDDEYSTVAGLGMGAVDYIAKPFRARELLARIAAATRKNKGIASTLLLGDIEIDTQAATVRKRGKELALSALEYRLLLLFSQRPGALITRAHLREALWDSAGDYVSDNTLNVYIKRLREKIEDNPVEPQLITTVRGLGYKAGA